jgi:serine protease Do
MSGNTRWPLTVSLGLSIVLMTSVLPAGAAGSTTVQSTVAQSTTPRATDPAFAGALPESYPWVRLADTLTPAVVNVRTTSETRRTRTPQVPEPFRRFFPQPPQTPQPPEGGGEREGRPRGVGSGFIIDADGYIVTNHHVVDGSRSIEVQLSDGRTFQPKVIGSDAETDLALLKIEATGLPMIPLGSSSALKVAEPVMAIGNPFGFDHTVTVGIVSGMGRFIGQGRFDDFIQTDAAINPGNSGGPLINTRGEAIGINSAIRSSSGGFQGIGFAIPVDLAKPILGQLRATGKVTRGWLGVSIQPLTDELAKSFGIKGTQGALVASVSDDSPAAKAGFKPGDVIVTFDGKNVEGPRVLPGIVANTPVGRAVPVVVLRDGQRQTVTVTVGSLADSKEARVAAGEKAPGPENRATEKLGLALQELTPELAKQLGVQSAKGVVVTEVKPDSPAAQAGIAAGDVIREVNRMPVQGIQDVERGLTRGPDPAQVLLRVEREGSQRYVVVGAG